jgi:hypothetical protein
MDIFVIIKPRALLVYADDTRREEDPRAAAWNENCAAFRTCVCTVSIFDHIRLAIWTTFLSHRLTSNN